MPWEIKKSGSQYCVYKKGAKKPIPGGCHATRADALKHQRALYSNVHASDASPMTPYLDEDGIWRVDEVPMISTGIEYSLATGKFTFTEDDLSDAVNAANNDPAVTAPRVKLGHSSGYNEMLVGDAEPAFGRWENLHLGDNGQTIYGSMVGLPEWLAQVLPVAYPNRSIEGAPDVETVTGKSHKLVISACVLLGVRWPGCSVLKDLPVWYGAEVPDAVEFDEELAASEGGNPMKAAVDVSLIRRRFYNDGPGAENYKYWIRGERFDNNDGFQLIVDMGDGELCRYPVNVDGSDVEFGDYVIVTEEYPDKAVAAQAVLAGMAISDPEMTIHASRADTDPRPTTNKGGSMDEETRSRLAASLHLPEDASEEQINAKLQENAIAAAATPPTAPPETTPGDVPGTPGGPPAPAPPSDEGAEEEGDEEGDDDVEAGTVTLDRATFNQLKRGSETALRLEAAQIEEGHNRILDDAIKAGKFPPARREHYKKLLSSDPVGGKQLIASLGTGMVPVTERGKGGNGDQDGEGEGLPEYLFPEIAGIRAGANRRGPGHVQMAREGS